MNLTDEYDGFINCTDKENEDINISLKYLLLSMPSGIILTYVSSLITWTFIKHSKNGCVSLPKPSSSFYIYRR